MTVTESVSTLEVIDLSSSVITLLTNCGVVLNLNTILLPSIHLRQQYILTRELYTFSSSLSQLRIIMMINIIKCFTFVENAIISSRN